MRLLHLADLHPQANATYAGKLILDPATGCSVGLTDFKKSVEAVLAWEAEHPCDLAVLAGDLFNTARPTPAEYTVIEDFLLSILERMSCVIIAGNHDQDVNSATATALEPLRPLIRARKHAPHELHIMTAPDRAIIQTGAGKVCVTGLPYPSKGRLQAAGEQAQAAETVMADMNEGLRKIVEAMSQVIPTDCLNVMVAHGTVGSAQVGEQPRSIAHDLMIPVDLMDRFDYVALGHIHRHQQVAPNAWYAGSLLCQSFGEKDEPKGWCAVELERGQAPQVTHIENPHSRQHVNIAIADIDEAHVLFSDEVFRIVGDVSESDYPEACLKVAKFEQSHPFTQNSVEVARTESRIRDAGMSALLSEDEAVERVVRGLVDENQVPAVMAAHQALREEVGT